MGIMTKSFALPDDLDKALQDLENVYFTKTLIEKILIYCYNNHDHPGKINNWYQF